MPNINVKIKPNLPLNVVQIAHIGSDTPDTSNSISIDYKDINPGLANYNFLKDYSFDIILDSTQSNGELGIGVAGLLDSNVNITNIASANRFGVPVPLFYKYLISNLTIVMPVDTVEYASLKLSAPTAADKEKLADMETTIDNSILDRIYFTDIYNEIKLLKFNITKEYLLGNNFDITVYVENASNVIDSSYIIYSNGTDVYRKLLNAVPTFTRKAWYLGNISYGDL